MNRVSYWLRSQTRYGLHSPYIYRLYDEVLYAALRKSVMKQLPSKSHHLRCRQYYEELFKLVNYFRPAKVVLNDADDAAACQCISLACPQAQKEFSPSALEDITFTVGKEETIALLKSPHRSAEQALHWQQLQQCGDYRVSLDLYDVGILLNNPHLSPQHFLLKGWGW